MVLKLSAMLLCSSLAASNSSYSLIVHLNDAKIQLLNGNVIQREYKAGTVKRGLPHPIGEGTILAIYFNPVWNPMPETRRTYRERGIELPPAVSFGHKEHMLGVFKMVLSHKSPRYNFSGAYSIHGCKSEVGIGTRVSGGCVRMKNQEGKELATLLKGELDSGRSIKVLIVE